MSRETGAGAIGHAGMRARLVFRLDLKFVRGVLGLQGTDISYFKL
jgi:hypothetical protein